MKTTTLTTLLLLFIVFSRAQSVAIIPFSTGAANDYSAGVVDAVNTGFIEDKLAFRLRQPTTGALTPMHRMPPKPKLLCKKPRN